MYCNWSNYCMSVCVHKCLLLAVWWMKDLLYVTPTHRQAARAGNVVHAMLQYRRKLERGEHTPVKINLLKPQICSAWLKLTQCIPALSPFSSSSLQYFNSRHFNSVQFIFILCQFTTEFEAGFFLARLTFIMTSFPFFFSVEGTGNSSYVFHTDGKDV